MRMTKFQKYLLAKQLLDIRCKVNKIDQGGCGVFALHLYRRLVELGFKPKIRVVRGTSGNYYSLKDIKRNFSNNYTHSFGHVFLRLGKNIIDSNGVFTDDNYSWFSRYGEISGTLPDSILEEACTNGEWCHNFNRRQIPKMINLINNINL